MGLKESKDLCDNLHLHPGRPYEFDVRTSNDDIDYKWRLMDGLKNIDGKFIVNGGSQWERNIKMLQLGIGDKSDYIEAIKDNLLGSNSEDLLTFVLNKLSKEDLQQALNHLHI